MNQDDMAEKRLDFWVIHNASCCRWDQLGGAKTRLDLEPCHTAKFANLDPAKKSQFIPTIRATLRIILFENYGRSLLCRNKFDISSIESLNKMIVVQIRGGRFLGKKTVSAQIWLEIRWIQTFRYLEFYGCHENPQIRSFKMSPYLISLWAALISPSGR